MFCVCVFGVDFLENSFNHRISNINSVVGQRSSHLSRKKGFLDSPSSRSYYWCGYVIRFFLAPLVVYKRERRIKLAGRKIKKSRWTLRNNHSPVLFLFFVNYRDLFSTRFKVWKFSAAKVTAHYFPLLRERSWSPSFHDGAKTSRSIGMRYNREPSPVRRTVRGPDVRRVLVRPSPIADRLNVSLLREHRRPLRMPRYRSPRRVIENAISTTRIIASHRRNFADIYYVKSRETQSAHSSTIEFDLARRVRRCALSISHLISPARGL